MTDHSDLVARLRHGEGQDWDMPYATREEAADHIETQAATIEALRAELAGRDAAQILDEMEAFWLVHEHPPTIMAELKRRGLVTAATAIATGSYRETESD